MATHEDFSRGQTVKQSGLRAFGGVFVVAFLLIGLWPLWSRGDDVCCPRRASERDYAWDATKKTFVRQVSRTVPLLDR